MSAEQPTPTNNDRVFHIFHHAFRLGGGLERCAVLLSQGLKQLGRRVVVHTMVADATLCESLGIELDLLPFKGFPRKLQTFRFFREIERVRQRIEGVEIGFGRVRAKHVNVVAGPHRGYLARRRKSANLFDWLNIWIELRTFPFAWKLIAHSDLIAEDLARHYPICRSRIRVLYPPVDERFIRPTSHLPPRDELRQKFGWPSDKVVFLFPSNGHANKGLYRICEALKGLDERALLAVAGRPLRKSPPSFVKYLGFVDNMPEAYHAADFTILASYYESFGLVGPESILCGTRVVFEENIGCLAVIKPEFVSTFSVWDTHSMREAIRRAIALAREDRHHFDHPVDALRYDPSAIAHARAVVATLSPSTSDGRIGR